MQKLNLYNKICRQCGKEFTTTYSPKTILGKMRKFCSRQCYYDGILKIENLGRYKKGENPSPKTQFKKGLVPWNYGKSFLCGEKHWNWQGGITAENFRIRNSFEFRDWRRKVFERDDFTCQDCGERGGVLHADHIKPFSLYPSLRFEITNGRTLCKDCHLQTATWGGRVKQKVYE